MPADLEVTFQDGLLTIQGERHPVDDVPGDKAHRAERRYGAFRRSVTLPGDVHADKIDATTQDGVLQILVPKTREVQAKHIQVHSRPGETGGDRDSGQERRLTARAARFSGLRLRAAQPDAPSVTGCTL